LMLGCGTQLFQQLGGINVISYYMPTLLIESVGLADSMSRLLAALAAIPYLIASGVAAPLVERYGRRYMMIVSTLIQLFCFLMLTILIHFTQEPGYSGSEQVAKASVVFFFLYYIGFGLGMLGM
jgi:MFS family permease